MGACERSHIFCLAAQLITLVAPLSFEASGIQVSRIFPPPFPRPQPFCAILLWGSVALHQNYKRPQEVVVCSESIYHFWRQAPTFGARPLEPYGGPGRNLISNTARTRLLLNGEELPWPEWAAEFRQKIPQEIKDLMDAYAARDAKKVDREEIKRRIEELRELYNPSCYIPTQGAIEKAGETNLIGGTPTRSEQVPPAGHPPSGGTKVHPIYSAFIKETGEEALRVKGQSYPEIKWVSVDDGTRDPSFMEDRAAHYAKEAHFLSINADFRIFDDLITLIEIRNPAVPGGRESIEERVRRHVEMSLIETILTFQAISGSKEWPDDAVNKGLSEEALTVAVSLRQHIVHAAEAELKAKGLSRIATLATA